MASPPGQFPTDPAGLGRASVAQAHALRSGDTFALRIALVASAIGGAKVRMLAYDDSVPGPLLRVDEGSHLHVDVLNEGDLETTVHWHGNAAPGRCGVLPMVAARARAIVG